jgi:hypothetical protein
MFGKGKIMRQQKIREARIRREGGMNKWCAEDFRRAKLLCRIIQ